MLRPPYASRLTPHGFYPCRCLCRGFGHKTLTTPRRRMTLHLEQIGFTDDLTFITNPEF